MDFFKIYQIYLFLSSYPKIRDRDFNKKENIEEFWKNSSLRKCNMKYIIQIIVPFIDDLS